MINGPCRYKNINRKKPDNGANENSLFFLCNLELYPKNKNKITKTKQNKANFGRMHMKLIKNACL